MWRVHLATSPAFLRIPLNRTSSWRPAATTRIAIRLCLLGERARTSPCLDGAALPCHMPLLAFRSIVFASFYFSRALFMCIWYSHHIKPVLAFLIIVLRGLTWTAAARWERTLTILKLADFRNFTVPSGPKSRSSSRSSDATFRKPSAFPRTC